MEQRNEREVPPRAQGSQEETRLHYALREAAVTFEQWWNLHKQAICICPGTCLWRILEVQEGWADEKARKRLLGFLKIEPTDQMPPEYVKHAEQTDVPSKN